MQYVTDSSVAPWVFKCPVDVIWNPNGDESRGVVYDFNFRMLALFGGTYGPGFRLIDADRIAVHPDVFSVFCSVMASFEREKDEYLLLYQLCGLADYVPTSLERPLDEQISRHLQVPYVDDLR